LFSSQPTIIRRSINKISSVETPSRPSEESNKKKLSQSITKRKHSISPIPHTPITIKKRAKTDSSIKKTHSKRKETKTEEEEEEEESENEEDKEKLQKPTVNKRKLNLDLSSKLIILRYTQNQLIIILEYKTPPAFLNDSLPDTISANDVYLFLDARKNSTKLISDV